jgi:hypothetical protein
LHFKSYISGGPELHTWTCLSNYALNASLHGILDTTDLQTMVFHIYCTCNHKMPMVLSLDMLHLLTVPYILKTISSSSMVQQPTSGPDIFSSLPSDIPIWKLYAHNIFLTFQQEIAVQRAWAQIYSHLHSSKIKNSNDYATESK